MCMGFVVETLQVTPEGLPGPNGIRSAALLISKGGYLGWSRLLLLGGGGLSRSRSIEFRWFDPVFPKTEESLRQDRLSCY